jgi:hypothetical protein
MICLIRVICGPTFGSISNLTINKKEKQERLGSLSCSNYR